MLPMALAQSSSDSSAIHYVLPVLWVMLFPNNGANGPESKMTCFVQFARCWHWEGAVCCFGLHLLSEQSSNLLYISNASTMQCICLSQDDTRWLLLFEHLHMCVCVCVWHWLCLCFCCRVMTARKQCLCRRSICASDLLDRVSFPHHIICPRQHHRALYVWLLLKNIVKQWASLCWNLIMTFSYCRWITVFRAVMYKISCMPYKTWDQCW